MAHEHKIYGAHLCTKRCIAGKKLSLVKSSPVWSEQIKNLMKMYIAEQMHTNFCKQGIKRPKALGKMKLMHLSTSSYRHRPI